MFSAGAPRLICPDLARAVIYAVHKRSLYLNVAKSIFRQTYIYGLASVARRAAKVKDIPIQLNQRDCFAKLTAIGCKKAKRTPERKRPIHETQSDLTIWQNEPIRCYETSQAV